jgi:hypothetical protein
MRIENERAPDNGAGLGFTVEACAECGAEANSYHHPGCTEAPHVCPGCYAVSGERCAPGCIDAEMEREREEALVSGSESFDDEREETAAELELELTEARAYAVSCSTQSQEMSGDLDEARARIAELEHQLAFECMSRATAWVRVDALEANGGLARLLQERRGAIRFTRAPSAESCRGPAAARRGRAMTLTQLIDALERMRREIGDGDCRAAVCIDCDGEVSVRSRIGAGAVTDLARILEPHRQAKETTQQALERIVEEWDWLTEHPTHWGRIQAALLPHFIVGSKAGVDATIADTCERLLREHRQQGELLAMQPTRQLSLFEEDGRAFVPAGGAR